MANFSDEERELLALELEKRPDALVSCVILTNNANCALRAQKSKHSKLIIHLEHSAYKSKRRSHITVSFQITKAFFKKDGKSFAVIFIRR